MNTRKYRISCGSEASVASLKPIHRASSFSAAVIPNAATDGAQPPLVCCQGHLPATTIPTLKDTNDHSSTLKKRSGARNNCAVHRSILSCSFEPSPTNSLYMTIKQNEKRSSESSTVPQDIKALIWPKSCFRGKISKDCVVNFLNICAQSQFRQKFPKPAVHFTSQKNRIIHLHHQKPSHFLHYESMIDPTCLRQNTPSGTLWGKPVVCTTPNQHHTTIRATT